MEGSIPNDNLRGAWYWIAEIFMGMFVLKKKILNINMKETKVINIVRRTVEPVRARRRSSDGVKIDARQRS